MNMFPAPWVAIVDDRPDDSIGIINALSELGIPSVRFDGGELMPETPLPYVRILFLDLELGTGTVDVKHAAGAALRVLAPTSQSGPCLIFVWTAHAEVTEEFKRAFNSYVASQDPPDRVIPVAIIGLDKTEYWSASPSDMGHADTGMRDYKERVLSTALRSALDPYESLKTLMSWEALNSIAAGATTSAIYDIACKLGSDNHSNNDALTGIYRKLGEALEGNKRAGKMPVDDLRSSVFEILGVIQSDLLQRLASDPTSFPFDQYDVSTSTDGVAGALNTVLLTTSCADAKQPGALIRLTDLSHTSGAPCLDENSDRPFRALLSQVFTSHYNKKNKTALKTGCVLTAVEITPGCDYANEKRSIYRFLLGLLIPEFAFHMINTTPAYFRQTKPFYFDGRLYVLLFDARNFFTLPLDTELPTPIFGIRDHLRTDLQAWVGHHISRPGHVSIT